MVSLYRSPHPPSATPPSKKGMNNLVSFLLNKWKFTIYVNNGQSTYQKIFKVLRSIFYNVHKKLLIIFVSP